MAQSCILEFYYADGAFALANNILKLVFYKDCYSAGTELRGSIVWSGSISTLVRVRLTVGGRCIHDGYLEYARQETGARPVMSFSSKGWSNLLTQNEPVPGMNYSVDLAGLGAINAAIPNVTYEQNTTTVNYINVKEHSTIWDAIGAYAMKAYSAQPYISGTNCVSVTARTGTSFTYTADKVISKGSVCDRRSILSKAYMEDYDGQYSVSLVNPAAADTGIVREKYFAFDRQWLNSLSMGLQLRLDHSNRRSKMSFIKLLGYSGEELFDSITVGSTTKTVGGIELTLENGRAEALYYTMEQ